MSSVKEYYDSEFPKILIFDNVEIDGIQYTESSQDKYIKCSVISKTDNPNTAVWRAQKQCVTEGNVTFFTDGQRVPSERKAGEICINALLGGKFHDNKGHHCYDSETEVLTGSGFRRWEDVTKEDQLYAVDPITFESVLETPTELHKFEYEGDMIQFANTKCDLLVTPNHRMVVSLEPPKEPSIYRFELADGLQDKYFKMKRTSVCQGSGIKLPKRYKDLDTIEFSKLVGFWIGDGDKYLSSTNVCRFNLRVPRKIEYLQSINIGVKGTQGVSTVRQTITLDRINIWLNVNCIDDDGNKVIPDIYMDATLDERLALFDGLRNSDGSIKRNTWTYSSCSFKLVNQIQEIASISGLSVTINTHKRDYPQNHNTCYLVNFSDKDEIIFENYDCRKPDSQVNKIVKNYNGFVYCATVSTGALIVRRNDKVCISGNSPWESADIMFNFIGFSHRVMQQFTRSRIGISPAVQSFRYTGSRIAKAYDIYQRGSLSINDFVEQFYYIRPVGCYADREGKKYTFTEDDRERRIRTFFVTLIEYAESFNDGMPEEMNAGILGMDARQNWTGKFNARSLCAFFDRRSKKDAQLEIQTMCNLMMPLFREWMPELAEWYYINRWKKARLNP